MSLYAFSGAIELGLVYGLMALGVYITFRVLDFPDLTVDGSLTLGAAVTAVCITKGLNPFLALVPAMAAGFLAGTVTGFLTTKLRILHLLSSILTMTALYSVNIRVMGGRPNIALLGRPTVFDPIRALDVSPYLVSNILFLALVAAVVAALVWLIRTEYGQALLATGANPKMITSLGVNTHFTVITGVGISNALVALSGGLIAQNQGTADVGMGVGTIVAGLASIVVGETIFNSRRITTIVISVVLGSVIYRLAIAAALSFRVAGHSFEASDLKLLTTVLVVASLVLPRVRKSLRARSGAAARNGRP
ncbi:MAG: ABC transporter permease [Deltaproteobacteria bacterium]|jgi:putative ABC transport system permease protein|nr:ABC transporter permease [Deltaproteobacteria bacterium]